MLINFDFFRFQIFMYSPWTNQRIFFKYYNQTGFFYIWIYLFLTKKKLNNKEFSKNKIYRKRVAIVRKNTVENLYFILLYHIESLVSLLVCMRTRDQWLNDIHLLMQKQYHRHSKCNAPNLLKNFIETFSVSLFSFNRVGGVVFFFSEFVVWIIFSAHWLDYFFSSLLKFVLKTKKNFVDRFLIL